MAEEATEGQEFEQIFVPNLKIKTENDLPSPLSPDDLPSSLSSDDLQDTNINLKLEIEEEDSDDQTDLLEDGGDEYVVLETSEHGEASSAGTLTAGVSGTDSDKDSHRTCPVCAVEFPTRRTYIDHLLTKRLASCKFCPESSSKKKVSDMHEHVRKIHGNFPSCPMCKEYFNSIKDMNEHRNICNKCRIMEEKPETVDLEYEEEIIDPRIKEFLFYNELKQKIKLNKNLNYTINCPSCCIELPYDIYFTDHYKFCFSKPNFMCPFCLQQKSSVQGCMEQHIAKHLTGYFKNTNCKLCNKSFFSPIGLQLHMKIHRPLDNEKPDKPPRTKKQKLDEPEVQDFPKTVYPPSKKYILNWKKKVLYIGNPNYVETETDQSSLYQFKKSKNTYLCQYCNEYVPKLIYVNHILCHLYKCPHCSLLVPYAESIIQHLCLDSMENVDDYKYFLSDFDFFTKNESVLKTAFNNKNVYLHESPGVGINRCMPCNLQFQFKCQLLAHEETHK